MVTKNVTVKLSHHKITNQLPEVMNLSRWRRRLNKANGKLLMATVRRNGWRVESPRHAGWPSIDELEPWWKELKRI